MRTFIVTTLLCVAGLSWSLALPFPALAQKDAADRKEAPHAAPGVKKGKAKAQQAKKDFSVKRELLKSMMSTPGAPLSEKDAMELASPTSGEGPERLQGVEIGKGVRVGVAKGNAGGGAIGPAMGLGQQGGAPGAAPGVGIGVRTSERSRLSGSLGLGVDENANLKPGTPEYKSRGPASGPSAGVGLSVSF